MNATAGQEDIFSVATLLYARLRRVNCRVIDVVYFMQNLDYAEHVMELALETKDPELKGYVERLKRAWGLDEHVPAQVKSAPAQKAQQEEGHVSFSLF